MDRESVCATHTGGGDGRRRKEKARERGREEVREGERQLEKIYPRVVKGKDIGVPRLAADEMDAGFHAGPLEGMRRTDGPTKGCRRCIDALGAASPMGDHEPPIGVQAEWWQGRGDAGGGRACEAGLRSTTPRRGLDRRGARCASTGFQRSWKPRTAGSSSMRAGLSRVSRRCMRFLGFHFFLASVSFENSRIIASSSILDERLFQMGNLWEYSNYLG